MVAIVKIAAGRSTFAVQKINHVLSFHISATQNSTYRRQGREHFVPGDRKHEFAATKITATSILIYGRTQINYGIAQDLESIKFLLPKYWRTDNSIYSKQLVQRIIQPTKIKSPVNVPKTSPQTAATSPASPQARHQTLPPLPHA